MEEREKLIAELKELNKEYLKLDKARMESFPKNYRKCLEESGQMVIDFYNKIFIPNYSNLDDESIDKAKCFLEFSSNRAEEDLRNENYFGLAVLFLDKGKKIDEPNNLERLIKELE